MSQQQCPQAQISSTTRRGSGRSGCSNRCTRRQPPKRTSNTPRRPSGQPHGDGALEEPHKTNCYCLGNTTSRNNPHDLSTCLQVSTLDCFCWPCAPQSQKSFRLSKSVRCLQGLLEPPVLQLSPLLMSSCVPVAKSRALRAAVHDSVVAIAL